MLVVELRVGVLVREAVILLVTVWVKEPVTGILCD